MVFKNLQNSCQKRKKGTGGAVSACQKEYFECIWIFAWRQGLVSTKKRLFIMRFLLRGVWHLIHPTSEVFYSYSETSCGCCWGRRPSLLSTGTSVSCHRAEHVHVCALSRAKDRITNLSSSMKESKEQDQKGLRGTRPCWCVSAFKWF